MCFEYEFLIFFYASNPRETLCLNVKKIIMLSKPRHLTVTGCEKGAFHELGR